MTDNRFHELLEAFVDQTLGGEYSHELRLAFEADPPLKKRFVEELQLANSLCGLSFLDAKVTLASDVMESIRHGKNSPDISESVLSELRPTSSKITRFPFRKIAIGLAAAITLALFVTFQPDHSLAVVTNLIDAQWEDGSTLSEGAKIGRGQLNLSAGIARIDFKNGVRLTLEGPVEFELIGPSEMRLHSGNLTAHVPPEGIGFLVHTERAKIVDLGTTFGISVSKGGATDVAVFEGEVEVTSLKSSEEKIIHEGSGVTLADGANNIAPQQLHTRAFRAWPILFGVLNTGGQIRFVNAQPIRNPADVIDAENIMIFPERFGAKPKGDLKVTLSKPGKYRPKDLVNGEEIFSLPLGRRVDSYLLQYNPPFVDGIPNSEQKRFIGQVTFNRPIVAIIANRDQLRATDELLGKSRFEYSTEKVRGLEHGDSLTLSKDRKTLEIDWLVMQALKRGKDQIRVLVDASNYP